MAVMAGMALNLSASTQAIHRRYLPGFHRLPSSSLLFQVDGFDRRWDGDLLVASLKAQTLFRLRLEKDHVLHSEPIWIGQRIRDITQLQDGQ